MIVKVYNIKTNKLAYTGFVDLFMKEFKKEDNLYWRKMFDYTLNRHVKMYYSVEFS